MPEIESFFRTLEAAHHLEFPAVPRGTLIGFLGTTSAPAAPTFGVHRVRSLAPSPRGSGVHLTLEGGLPRPIEVGEQVAVCLVDLGKYRGYQIKTRVASRTLPGAKRTPLVEEREDEMLVRGESVYTVHHSPNVLNVFESVPFEDVERDLSPVKHAALVIGQRANVSPRFIFHRERRGRDLVLFHGDGLVHKTYLNLKQNSAVSYLVTDLGCFEGLSLSGECQEHPTDLPGEGGDKVRAGFAALGFGLTRIFTTSISSVVDVKPGAGSAS